MPAASDRGLHRSSPPGSAAIVGNHCNEDKRHGRSQLRRAGGSGIAFKLFVLVRQSRHQRVIAVEKRMFTIPAEQASYIDQLVAAGTYASASAVVSAGLAALQ